MVNCSVCAIRIDHAYENCGPFQTALGQPKVSDTCEDCARELANAIVATVTKIQARLAKKRLCLDHHRGHQCTRLVGHGGKFHVARGRNREFVAQWRMTSGKKS